MAVTLISELRDGLNYFDNLEGAFGGGFSAIYKSDNLDPDDAIQEVIDYLDAGNSALGQQFPEAPYDKMIVTSRSITPVSNDDRNHYLVTIQFGPKARKTVAATADWVFTFSTSLGTADTNKDAYGSFIEVGTLAGDEGTVDGNGDYTAVPKTSATVSKRFPSVSIRATGQVENNPFSAYNDKVGTLNTTAMTVDGQTLASGTTMLVSANSSTPNDGEFYLVDYEFEYRPTIQDWLVYITAINPKTGQPWSGISGSQDKTGASTYDPVSATPDKGCVGFLMYDATDLGSLITV
jgi:hypothetical protein